MRHVARRLMGVQMPQINVTEKELEAILFFRDETSDKCTACEDESYVDDVNRHSEAVTNLRVKWHRANNHKHSQRTIKNALKIANEQGYK